MQNEQNVWKIGTRWGNMGPSNFDMFLNYQCAFISLDDAERVGDWRSAKIGDLLLACDGSKPVAIGIMQSPFENYQQSSIQFCKSDEGEWINGSDNVRICKARFCLIPEGENAAWCNDAMKRFCAHSNKDIVIKKWEEYSENESKGVFDIKSRTVELLSSDIASGIFTVNTRYRIPIYQRPYSWSEPQLRRLLEDLKQGVIKQEPMFLGTMQLSAPIPLSPNDQPKKCAYDIIDGQQRTTTLMLLHCLLEERLEKESLDHGREKNYITHVNRGAAQRDLDEFWEVCRNKGLHAYKDSNNANPYLANIAILNNLLNAYFRDADEENPNLSPNALLDYIEQNLRFVVIETHASISKTLKIFNTINTTGLDLGSDDLFKIRFYEYRKDICQDTDDIFDKISGVYQKVADVRRVSTREMSYSMSDVLDVYQSVLVAKYNLENETALLPRQTFFDCLFDSLLNVRKWPAFKTAKVDMQVSDLNAIVDAFERVAECLEKHENARIMHRFLQETRYWGRVKHYLVTALYFKAIDESELEKFDTLLFKLLVPPSLYWAQKVYAVHRKLTEILHSLPKHEGKGIELLKGYLFIGLDKDNIDPQKQFRDACEQQISGYAKWKNLICRLCEYLLALDKDNLPIYKRLFAPGIDIEHIQCCTPNNPDDLEGWDDELHRLGNLVVLESSLNRSVGNRTQEKPAAYAQSAFESVRALHDKVARWKPEDAKLRRIELTERMRKFLFTA